MVRLRKLVEDGGPRHKKKREGDGWQVKKATTAKYGAKSRKKTGAEKHGPKRISEKGAVRDLQ